MSGALKNAIDWLQLLANNDPLFLTDKPVGLISVAGGSNVSRRSTPWSSQCGRYGGLALPLVAPISHARRAFDHDGRLREPELQRQLGAVAQAVAAAAERLRDLELFPNRAWLGSLGCECMRGPRMGYTSPVASKEARMRITVVGRGNVEGALARLWERAGHTVTALGRDGGDASDADAVLVAVPSDAIANALNKVRGLKGKVAIDATNPFAGRNENYESLAHEVKAVVGGAVAKAFNLQHSALYDRIDEEPVRASNLFAAEDGARRMAEHLSRDAGFDPIFVGGLEHARALEDAVGLFGAIRRAGGGPHFHRFAKPGNFHSHDHRQGTPRAYWINTFRSVADPLKLAEYVKLAGPVMLRSGGRFLARGRPTRVYEAGVMERTVVIEFDSAEQAIAAYESPDYREALRALGAGAERDIRIIEAAS